MTIIKTEAGDALHQWLAIRWFREGLSRTDVLNNLKQNGYKVKINDKTYAVTATAIVNIMLGLEIAAPTKRKKLQVLD